MEVLFAKSQKKKYFRWIKTICSERYTIENDCGGLKTIYTLKNLLEEDGLSWNKISNVNIPTNLLIGIKHNGN